MLAERATVKYGKAGDIVLSVVIVHYNTLELSRGCLLSLKRFVSQPCEVFLVDNASTDGSGETLAQEFPWMELIRLEAPSGFGAANNRAAARARGRYLLFLNSDTELLDNCLEDLLAFMEAHGECVMCTPRLERRDGSLDHSCRRSFPSPEVALFKMLGLNRLFPGHKRFARYDLRFLDERACYEVEAISGAFMLTRRTALEHPAAPFDEDYFFYGEDLDFCFREKQRGGAIWYLGTSTVKHYKGGSTNKREAWVIKQFHLTMRTFYDKHYRRQYAFPVTWFVYLGIYLRLVYSLLRNVFLPAKVKEA